MCHTQGTDVDRVAPGIVLGAESGEAEGSSTVFDQLTSGPITQNFSGSSPI